MVRKILIKSTDFVSYILTIVVWAGMNRTNGVTPYRWLDDFFSLKLTKVL